MIFNPQFDGSASISTPATEFLARFRRRVEAGLLSGQPHPRSRYAAQQTGPNQLHVTALNRLTAFNVGLNEIELRAAEAGRIEYTVRYWRWAGYALGLSAGIGTIIAVVFVLIDLPEYVERHTTMIPGLTVAHHVILAWSMVVFWGFIWPWLLIALHKRPAQRLMERLIAEVDHASAPVAH